MGIISISMVRKNTCVDNQTKGGGVYLEEKRRKNQLMQYSSGKDGWTDRWLAK